MQKVHAEVLFHDFLMCYVRRKAVERNGIIVLKFYAAIYVLYSKCDEKD